VRIFFVLAAFAFTCVYPYMSWVNNPNENVRTYMTMALVEEHTFKIDAIVGRYGWVNDMASVPEPEGGRHLFSVKGPAVSLAGVPVYWAMTKIAPHLGTQVPTDTSSPPARQAWLQATTFVLRLFTIQIPCFVFLLWFERWLRATSPDPVLRLCAVAGAGLGTNYLAYSLMFASHAPFAVAAFTSFAIITSERARHPLDPRQRRLSRAFLAGFFAGLATLLEYHAGPTSVCLALYALVTFWRPTRYAAFSLGAAINAVILAFFQWRCFKSPFTTGHKLSENQMYAHLLSQGYIGGVGKPDFSVLKNISFSPGYGFFGTSPFMWLGLLAIPFALAGSFGPLREQSQRRTATIGWMGIMGVLFLTVSAAINWRGGWTVGPRYLGAAPPFFAYGALCALETIAQRSALRRAAARGIAGGAALASFLTIGFVGLHFNTIPEDVGRPFAEFTLPLALDGFVPHHALELFGATSSTFFYFVAGCGAAATLVAALAPSHEARGTWPVRLAVFLGVFGLAMIPAFSTPGPEEVGDYGERTRPGFANAWQPAGRDRLAHLRQRIEQGGAQPCDWVRLARMERLLSMHVESTRDAAKAGQPMTDCPADPLDRLLEPPTRLLERESAIPTRLSLGR
jgi:hypothetical protein